MTRYRVGRQLGRTLYRGDQLVGLLDTEEQARACAAALNEHATAAAYVGRLVVLEQIVAELRDLAGELTRERDVLEAERDAALLRLERPEP